MKYFITLFIAAFMITQDTYVIANFSEEKGTENWYVVDDRVMGGISQGTIQRSTDNNLLYTGMVTTESNGGFSSIRHGFSAMDVSPYTKVLLKVKGDGKEYQFRLKSDQAQQFSYTQAFSTSGTWETIELELAAFYPTFRGNPLNRPNFPGETLEEIAILIGTKNKENFSLEVASIILQ